MCIVKFDNNEDFLFTASTVSKEKDSLLLSV
jgi:hypothetical protein